MLEKAIQISEKINEGWNTATQSDEAKIHSFITTALKIEQRLETALAPAININPAAFDLIVSIERVINYNRGFESYSSNISLKMHSSAVVYLLKKHAFACLVCLWELKKEAQRMA